MIQLLSGDNTYEIRARRARMIADFSKEKSDEAVAIVDGSTVAVNDLPQILMGVSLFAPQRLVVIDDAHTQKAVWEKLTDYLGQIGQKTEVVLVAPAADKRTKTYKWLQKNAEVTVTNALNEAQLASWIQHEARAQGLEIAPNIARYLIEYTAGDQWQLANDIEKLKLSESSVTPELIRNILIPNPTSSAFDLLDAALNRQSGRVRELLEGVRSHEDPYRFFGLLSNQIFALLIIAEAGNRPADVIVRESGLHPFVVRKTSTLAHRMKSHELSRLASQTATTDMQLKSSSVEPWLLIAMLLKSIATK